MLHAIISLSSSLKEVIVDLNGWMERSGLNEAQPWDQELLCGRERKRKRKEEWKEKKCGGGARRVERRGKRNKREGRSVRETRSEG